MSYIACISRASAPLISMNMYNFGIYSEHGYTQTILVIIIIILLLLLLYYV